MIAYTKLLSYFSTITHVVGTQKNRRNERSCERLEAAHTKIVAGREYERGAGPPL